MRYRIAVHQSDEGFSVSVPGLPRINVSIGSVSIDFLCGSIDTDPIDPDPIDPSLLIPLLIPIDPTIDPIDPIDPEIKL